MTKYRRAACFNEQELQDATRRAFEEEMGRAPCTDAEVSAWAEHDLERIYRTQTPEIFGSPDEWPEWSGEGYCDTTAPLTDVDDILDSFDEFINMQLADGTWDYDPYLFGMANGMLFMRSLVDGKPPQYVEAPAVWRDEKYNSLERSWEEFQAITDWVLQNMNYEIGCSDPQTSEGLFDVVTRLLQELKYMRGGDVHRRGCQYDPDYDRVADDAQQHETVRRILQDVDAHKHAIELGSGFEDGTVLAAVAEDSAHPLVRKMGALALAAARLHKE